MLTQSVPPRPPVPPAQVETQLRQVNAHFARLNGMSGAHVLDLYGRTAAQQAAPSAPQQALSRKPSARLPLRDSTRELIRQAHSKLLSYQPGSPSAAGGVSGSQPGSFLPSRAPSLTFGQGGGAPPLGLGSGSMSRHATVRFDVPGTDAQAPASPKAGGQRLVQRVASASGAGGVLQIPDEREERLQPYRFVCAPHALAACLPGLS